MIHCSNFVVYCLYIMITKLKIHCHWKFIVLIFELKIFQARVDAGLPTAMVRKLI